MRSVFMGSRRLGGEVLSYHLLVEETGDFGETYGVMLEGFGQTAAISRVTASQCQALDLLEKLQQGTVTPVGLRDVVEDWLLM